MADVAPTKNAAAMRQGLVSLAVTLLIMGLVLFGAAGTIDWPLGWGFVASFLIAVIVSMPIIWRVNPEIFAARSKIQPGTSAWDYLFIALISAGFIGVLPVAGLDFRFGWSSAPGWVIAAAYLLFVVSFAGQVWPLSVNRHFEPGVRIQQDRAQTVIDTGPYAIVRHPGYISGALLSVSIALMLASWWALVPAAVVILALAVRTTFEERTLRAGLPGYADYTRRVTYRWLPGIW